MAKRRSTGRSSGRPLREWITDALREGGALTTSKLRKRVKAISGALYHMNSVYITLRGMIKSGAVSVKRKGRQRLYQLAASGAVAKETIRRAVGRPPKQAPAIPAGAGAGPMAGSTALPHRLVMGEIAILHVGGETVISATNVHGELVLKKHRVPRG